MIRDRDGGVRSVARIALSGAICVAALLGAGCSESEQSPSEIEAIAFIAHGGFFTESGEQVEPTLERIRATQEHYIDLLKTDPRSAAVPEGLISELVADPIVANAVYLDQLLLAVAPKKVAYWQGVNNATRLAYLVGVRGEETPRLGETWHRGVSEAVAKKLKAAGVIVSETIHNGHRVHRGSLASGDPTATPLVIDTSGGDYIRQCQEHGVPTPTTVLDKKTWNHLGPLSTKVGFSTKFRKAELWSYQSSAPAGTCLALKLEKGSRPDHLDVICQGTISSKACFFEGDENTPAEPALDELFGGTALFGGPCSDCHAGENAFIIHPNDPVFAGLLNSDHELMPLDWYEPLIGANYPQNPPPMASLGPVTDGQQKCTRCHVQGIAGRFPRVTELDQYCKEVLKETVGNTMPPNGEDYHDYKQHGERIKQLCGMGDTGDTRPTNYRDDWKNVGAPTIASPIYACANVIGVQSLRLGGEVQLVVERANGTVRFNETRIVTDTSLEEFTIAGELKKGDRVYAFQVVDSVLSPSSSTVVVRSYLEDYPDGMPKPIISPNLFECGERIAAHHLPGARLETRVDSGAAISTRGGPTGLSLAAASGPFQVGDEVTVTQSLCGAVSPASDPVAAHPAPRTLPAPTISPFALYAGQLETVVTALLPGANLRISEAGYGDIQNVTAWPISWFNMKFYENAFGPLEQGDVIQLQQELCHPTSEVTEVTVLRCQNLPAPSIFPAFNGESFVYLEEHVDGATVRVWDAAGEELGEGKGPDLYLSRALLGGEEISVTQEVFGCFSFNEYYTEVLN